MTDLTISDIERRHDHLTGLRTIHIQLSHGYIEGNPEHRVTVLTPDGLQTKTLDELTLQDVFVSWQPQS